MQLCSETTVTEISKLYASEKEKIDQTKPLIWVCSPGIKFGEIIQERKSPKMR